MTLREKVIVRSRWSECEGDDERIAYLLDRLQTAAWHSRHLSPRARNSGDRVVVRETLREVGLLHALDENGTVQP